MSTPWVAAGQILAGNHVRLVPMEFSHVPGLFLAGRDPQVWTWVPFRVLSESDMEAYVRKAMADREIGDSFPFTIFDPASGDVMGSTRYYSLSAPNRNLEIGYTWLNPAVWRTPVNSECKFLLLNHAFESLGCLRVALRTDVRNLRSQRAIERLGAVREGVFRKHMVLPDGHVRDTVYYSITDEEWPGVKDRLLRGLRRDSPEA